MFRKQNALEKEDSNPHINSCEAIACLLSYEGVLLF